MTSRVLRMSLDPANPGQFFACCGLLELADRLWSGAEGWFDASGTSFCIETLEPRDACLQKLLEVLEACQLDNTMSAEMKDELASLGKLRQSDLSASQEARKKQLEGMRRDQPLTLKEPFHLTLDWWRDDRSGGSRFKTWAGQQSVIEIAKAMKGPIEKGLLRGVVNGNWFTMATNEGTPFNFDSDLGAQSAPIDVGFSLDPLGMRSRVRPAIELLTLVGLQRFRPAAVKDIRNRYRYSLWSTPLLPPAAAFLAASGGQKTGNRTFEFSLLYRTKYLKSFLPASRSKG